MVCDLCSEQRALPVPSPPAVGHVPASAATALALPALSHLRQTEDIVLFSVPLCLAVPLPLSPGFPQSSSRTHPQHPFLGKAIFNAPTYPLRPSCVCHMPVYVTVTTLSLGPSPVSPPVLGSRQRTVTTSHPRPPTHPTHQPNVRDDSLNA